jgi:predicted HicB family RNase H-like nuclease
MSKKRKEITLPEDVFSELEKLAKKDGRSLNNYIEKTLTKHVEEQKKR